MNIASRDRQLILSLSLVDTLEINKYLQASPGGEYRSRTDDLLRARQAL